MMKLLESIKENQNMYTKEEEKHILDEEAQKGRLFVHGYLCEYLINHFYFK